LNPELDRLDPGMRDLLAVLCNVRSTFTGTFKRRGCKASFRRQTVLLLDIRYAGGLVVADHLWFNRTKGFCALGHLRPGDVLRFDARVREYKKRYRGRCRTDYQLSYPTKIVRVEINQ
jgi:hypothetical protein